MYLERGKPAKLRPSGSSLSPKTQIDQHVVKVKRKFRDKNETQTNKESSLQTSIQSISSSGTRVAEIAKNQADGSENQIFEESSLQTSIQSISSSAMRVVDIAKIQEVGSETQTFKDSSLKTSRQSISSPTSQIKPHIVEITQDLADENETFKEPTHHTSLQSVSSSKTQIEPRVAKIRENLAAEREAETLEDTRTILTNASLSVPHARLIIACSHYTNYKTIDKKSDIIHLSQTPGGWNIFGVVQSIEHVDFTINIPFYHRPLKELSKRSASLRLNCQIIYDPASDNCYLVNATMIEIYLTSLDSPSAPKSIACGHSHVIHPGRWRISVTGGGEYYLFKNCLIEFLVLKRHFNVSIYNANNPLPVKRAAADDIGGPGSLAKRQKLSHDIKGIVTVQSTNLFPETRENTITHSCHPACMTACMTREIKDTTANPILELGDGEVALIRAPAKFNMRNTPAIYKLERITKIATTKYSSVFSCQHSRVPGILVAKVQRYSHGLFKDIAVFTAQWKKEKKILEKLSHKNIVSLRAYDARLFAIYLEYLPPRLNCKSRPIFTPLNARTILHDISSALAYLSEKGIVHYDVKPENIAYSDTRGAVLMDFGIASSINSGNKYHGGTPSYLPPDVLHNGIRGFPGDIWALGVTMLYVLGKVANPNFLRLVSWDELFKEESDTHKKMVEWLERISYQRRQLKSDDEVERLVFRMLHPKGAARVKAADIESALGVRK